MSLSVGFIGLGTMGMPMATNLVNAGHRVAGFSRTAATRDRFARAGGQAADSLADAAAADVICLMVPDSPDVIEVLTSPDGIFAHAHDGALIIDFSTIDPGVEADLAAQAAERGFDYLDAPVSGGEQGAHDATLSVMVGGSSAAFDRARGILAVVGTTVERVGPASSGQLVKAANQLLVAGHLAVLAEAVGILRTTGIELDAALRVLENGLAGSTVLERKATSMFAREFAPGFRAELHSKDLGIVETLAHARGVAIPVTALVAQLMRALVQTGRGHLDHAAVDLLISEWSGPTQEGTAP